MENRIFTPKKHIYLRECATVAGKAEKEGPLGEGFDFSFQDSKFGEDSWEKAESKATELAISTLMKKVGRKSEEIPLLFGGDLMNQCTATSFGIKESNIPFAGLYGACSTFAESILLGAITLESGYQQSCICCASSYFPTAERQFRTPLEYGAQRPPTAQCTATGCGAVLLDSEDREHKIRVTEGLFGRIIDGGITDAANMGAAMAPAAADTLLRYFRESGHLPEDFDVIATGDLGYEGNLLLREILDGNGLIPKDNLTDCGLLIYDRERQDMHCGGSGCACSALVTGAHFFPLLKEGRIKSMLLVGTGALMSPLTLQQKLSIPGIAHLVCFVKEED